MTTSKIIERIERQIGVAGLVELLSDHLSPTDLQSVLLEVYRRQAQHKQPAKVLSEHETNRFTRPASVSPIDLLRWEQQAFSELPAEVQPIILSPVCGLGASSVVGLTDQNRVMSTIYNTEVVSDSTNVLALECALRRQQLLRVNPKTTAPVHLASNHRLLRTQRYENSKALPHFSAFALCSAGRDSGNFQFELTALTLHIGVYLRALKGFLGANVKLRLAVTDFTNVFPSFLTQLSNLIGQEFPDVEYRVDSERESGRGYYLDHCFHIYAATPTGDFVELADGGTVDWTQRLLSNAKERCVISGIGSDGVCAIWQGYRNTESSI